MGHLEELKMHYSWDPVKYEEMLGPVSTRQSLVTAFIQTD